MSFEIQKIYKSSPGLSVPPEYVSLMTLKSRNVDTSANERLYIYIYIYIYIYNLIYIYMYIYIYIWWYYQTGATVSFM